MEERLKKVSINTNNYLRAGNSSPFLVIYSLMKNERIFLNGMKHGIPIGLAYFAVAFAIGISAKLAGLNAFQGFLASLVTYASAGEYAAFTLIKDNSLYIEMAAIILVANCRYILMSFSFSQRFKENESFLNRLLVGACITDEVYAITIARPGKIEPKFTYGAFLVAVFPWAIGTALGIIVGNLLPSYLVQALAASLYGMFIAIIIPPSKKDRKLIFVIGITYLISFFVSKMNIFMSEGIRIIVLTIGISLIFSFLFPKEEEDA